MLPLPQDRPPPIAHSVRYTAPVPKDAAVESARQLLEENLTRKQRRSYKAKGYFEVEGASGIVYRIERGETSNVLEMGGGRWCARFKHVAVRTDNCNCEHCRTMIPIEDLLLAEKLLIEADEMLFRATAISSS